MEQFKTVEELRAHIVAHCGAGKPGDCEGEGCQHDCCVLSTRELRNKYAAEYGCICGADCSKCKEYNNCYPTEEDKKKLNK